MPQIRLSSSLEDYLEAIYQIIKKKRAVRTKDISKELGVKNPSVTGALHSLSDKKLINYAPYDVITLTERGEKIAKEVCTRHQVLKDFFSRVLGIDDDSAEANACKMEHAISKDALERLTHFIEFIKTCPKAGTEWTNKFDWFCKKPESLQDCEQCITQCLIKVKAQQDKPEVSNTNPVAPTAPPNNVSNPTRKEHSSGEQAAGDQTSRGFTFNKHFYGNKPSKEHHRGNHYSVGPSEITLYNRK